MRDTLTHDPQADLRFLEAERTGERRWRIPMTAALATPADRLYGGAGIAAVTAVAEAATGRALRWVTCQFAATAAPGETLDVQVHIDAEGRAVTQAGVVVTAGDRTVLRAVTALGEDRDDAPSAAWVTMPDVPGPEECRPTEYPFDVSGTSLARVERRRAAGPSFEEFLTDEPREPGFVMCEWTRVAGAAPTTPAMLAWQADTVPGGTAAGLGQAMGGTSLDNTLRMVAPRPAEWVLLDVRPIATAAGYAYGLVHLWTPEGDLLGTASQTHVLRPFPT